MRGSEINKEQIVDNLTRLERNIHTVFLIGATLGALSSFARADFNLPMYAFLYIMWDQDDNNKI